MDIRIVKAMVNDANREFVKTLYETSFPPEERRPWEQLESLVNSGQGPELMLILADDTPVGFMTAWNLGHGPVTYIEHFAVDSSCRGLGIGGLAIDLLKEQRHAVILEVEPPADSEEARRRVKFYSRHGFRLCDEVDYIQPPYAPSLPSVKLNLMTAGPIDADLDAIIITLHRRVYNHP